MVPLSWKCATCGKEFKKNAILQKHVQTHTGEKPYSCYLCDKKFIKKSHAQRHMTSHSNNTLPQFSCTVEGCTKKFKFERTMKRHIQSTHVLYKCTFDGCEMAFNKKFKMRKHMREIHNDKFLKCTYEGCTSAFTTKRSFFRHVYSHEREYKCNVLGCDEVFKSRSVLRKHRETHKKVHCTTCDLVCPHKTAFKKHCKEAHPEPKKTFDCPYEDCSKTYSRGANLNQHIRVEHGGLRFHCQVEGCGKSFRYNINLKQHIASHEAPAKKTKKKRKRKSLAAKLARYKGELCELPVTYVDQNEDTTSPSESSLCKETQSDKQCTDISTDTSSHVEDKTEGTSSLICFAESLSSGSESVSKSLSSGSESSLKSLSSGSESVSKSLSSGSESVSKSLPTELPLCKETQSHDCSDISMDSSAHVEMQHEELSSAICSSESSSSSESLPKTLMEKLQSIIRDRECNKLCPDKNNPETNLSKEHAHVLECAASS